MSLQENVRVTLVGIDAAIEDWEHGIEDWEHGPDVASWAADGSHEVDAGGESYYADRPFVPDVFVEHDPETGHIRRLTWHEAVSRDDAEQVRALYARWITPSTERAQRADEFTAFLNLPTVRSITDAMAAAVDAQGDAILADDPTPAEPHQEDQPQ